LKEYLLANVRLFKKADLATLSRNGTTKEAYDRALTQILEPTSELRMSPWMRKPPTVDFFITIQDASGPGLSEICVRKDATIRAIRISHNLRLVDPFDRALLVNTIAHETIHLHRGEQRCTDIFNDGDDDIAQCHSMSYVVGNAAACSLKQGDSNWSTWQACMADQANLTPGHQKKPIAERDAFGCD
jgi:hypothetical protein